MAEKPERPNGTVPLRALILSLAAWAVPVIGVLVFPESIAEYRVLLWLLALVPALLLAYYRRWAGVSLVLGAGMAALSLVYVVGLVVGWPLQDWPLYVFVVTAYIAIALGVGWLSDVRREEEARRRAQEQLRKAEERYRTMFEQSRDAILLTGAAGQPLAANRAALELFGYSEDEVVRVDVASLFADEEDWSRLRERLDTSGFVRDHQVELLRKDDTKIVCLVTATVQRGDDGGVLGYQSIIRDVTKQRQLEQYVRDAHKMEAVDQLSGGIAHDFNNVLTVVLTSAAVIRQSLRDASPDVRACLDDLQDAARRGTQLIRKLSVFARREQLTLRPVNLTDCVAGFADTLRGVIPASIEIKRVVEDGLPPVLADPAAIEQILLNLATNSRDAMPDGGLLRITIDGTQLAEEDRERHGWVVPGRYVRLSVSDTGIGMDEEARQKVFDPFFTTKPSGSGTGLGMAVVYGLVKQHNGFVHVYSEPGRGTTVKVYLRAMDQAVAPAPTKLLAGEPREATETILLVEDEPPLRRTARRALERLGYRVLVASDGEEALELFGQHEADIELIVTDLVMPKLGGAELAQTLRQRGKQVKILFVSGYTSHDVRESSRLGADAPLLEKPWTIADLGRRVREVLDGS